MSNVRALVGVFKEDEEARGRYRTLMLLYLYDILVEELGAMDLQELRKGSRDHLQWSLNRTVVKCSAESYEFEIKFKKNA